MQVDLHCAGCGCSFAASSDPAPGEHGFASLLREGPWYALGDGETLEDRLYNTLTGRGLLCCPRCGQSVTWNQESLGRVSQVLLAEW